MPSQSSQSLQSFSCSVPRIPIAQLKADQFQQQFQQQGNPVIITGLLQPECDWTMDYLCEQLGTQKFILRHYGKERYQQDKRKWKSIGSGVSPECQSFLEYADLLRNRVAHEQDIYLAKASIQQTPLAETEVIATLNHHLENLGLRHPASHLNLWIGPSGHTECLHYDPTDGTLIQFHGSKKVILFPPSQTANLYPFPFYVHLRYGMRLRCWFSQVYPDRPDFQAFPKFRKALQHQYEVILNPGEALFIPVGWWHEVVALGDEMVCSVNRFWRVYPTRRAVLSRSRWRAYLGSACAMPNTVFSFVSALFSRERDRKLKEFLQKL